ncbi:hypothetical protein DPEC_G00104160 [Dallia pectoralis]|uniref:Uncharacterized protein n=1 Tax=Dallia pectoralis TaxID=75939 RepID=A0ACC2GXC6_DALPE|nr:hypothetical protein DPEC_G00104160 [Dallia pectoralis]
MTLSLIVLVASCVSVALVVRLADIKMVKIFIGNLPNEVDKDEIEALFTQHGTVTECAKFKNYAFVHMDDRKSATKAIRSLHLFKLHGRPINVEPSRGKNQGPVKLHVANVEKGNDEELRALFEEYGTVTECAVVKNFAFVHMSNSDEAKDAIKGLDNTDFQGKRIHVQISKSRPRGDEEDYGPPPPPDRGDYWPPPRGFPGDREPPHYRGRMPGGYPGPPPPPPPPPRRNPYAPERPYESEREGYGVVDYYEKYRARPAPYSGLAGYGDDRRACHVQPTPAQGPLCGSGASTASCPLPLLKTLVIESRFKLSDKIVVVSWCTWRYTPPSSVADCVAFPCDLLEDTVLLAGTP